MTRVSAPLACDFVAAAGCCHAYKEETKAEGGQGKKRGGGAATTKDEEAETETRHTQARQNAATTKDEEAETETRHTQARQNAATTKDEEAETETRHTQARQNAATTKDEEAETETRHTQAKQNAESGSGSLKRLIDDPGGVFVDGAGGGFVDGILTEQQAPRSSLEVVVVVGLGGVLRPGFGGSFGHLLIGGATAASHATAGRSDDVLVRRSDSEEPVPLLAVLQQSLEVEQQLLRFAVRRVRYEIDDGFPFVVNAVHHEPYGRARTPRRCPVAAGFGFAPLGGG